MKIAKRNTSYLFNEIPFGGVFEYDDTIYMRMNPIYSGGDNMICNAASLLSGRYELLDDDQEVIYYPNTILTFE